MIIKISNHNQTTEENKKIIMVGCTKNKKKIQEKRKIKYNFIR
jgi:hypothetical protein